MTRVLIGGVDAYKWEYLADGVTVSVDGMGQVWLRVGDPPKSIALTETAQTKLLAFIGRVHLRPAT